MLMHIHEIDAGIKALKLAADDFFTSLDTSDKVKSSMYSTVTDISSWDERHWDMLPKSLQEKSQSVQKLLLSILGNLQNHIKLSPLLTETDEKDLINYIKSMRSTLRLREYRSWNPSVIHDEGHVLGVEPSRQSDDTDLLPHEAREIFYTNHGKIIDLIDLVKAAPPISTGNLSELNRNIPTSYRKNTAFLIMQIAKDNPKVQDTYDVYVECFKKFNIKAIRADDIEHEGKITDRVMDEIRNSEYLLGDLTGERPNVYYEVGYAHALKRSVILYKEKGSDVHFDLADYNCPEYNGLRDLRQQLTNRLESMTNLKAR